MQNEQVAKDNSLKLPLDTLIDRVLHTPSSLKVLSLKLVPRFF